MREVGGRRGRLLIAVLCVLALAVPLQPEAETIADRICAGHFLAPSNTCTFKYGGSRIVVWAAAAVPSPTAGSTTVGISVTYTTETGIQNVFDGCSGLGLRATACAKTGQSELILSIGTEISCVVSATPGGARGSYWCSSTS